MTAEAQRAVAREALRRTCRKAVKQAPYAGSYSTGYADGQLQAVAWMAIEAGILSLDEVEAIQAEYGIGKMR